MKLKKRIIERLKSLFPSPDCSGNLFCSDPQASGQNKKIGTESGTVVSENENSLCSCKKSVTKTRLRLLT